MMPHKQSSAKRFRAQLKPTCFHALFSSFQNIIRCQVLGRIGCHCHLAWHIAHKSDLYSFTTWRLTGTCAFGDWKSYWVKDSPAWTLCLRTFFMNFKPSRIKIWLILILSFLVSSGGSSSRSLALKAGEHFGSTFCQFIIYAFLPADIHIYV